MATDQGVGGSNPLTHVDEKGVRTNVLAPFCPSPVGLERVRSPLRYGRRKTDVLRTSSVLSRTVRDKEGSKETKSCLNFAESDRTRKRSISAAAAVGAERMSSGHPAPSPSNLIGPVLQHFASSIDSVLIFSYTGSGKYFIHF